MVILFSVLVFFLILFKFNIVINIENCCVLLVTQSKEALLSGTISTSDLLFILALNFSIFTKEPVLMRSIPLQ
jgi:hypothetical protein